ncbi:hypothetical protein [Providencia huashanensis]
MKPIANLVYYKDNYNKDKTDVVVLEGSFLSGSPFDGIGYWEYFIAHVPKNGVYIYGISQDGFIHEINLHDKKIIPLHKYVSCKIDGNFYNYEERIAKGIKKINFEDLVNLALEHAKDY